MAISDYLFRVDPGELDRRRQLVRDAWDYRSVDHIPIHMVVTPDDQPGYNTREQFEDGDKQLEQGLAIARTSWESIPDGDYLPVVRPDVGCSCLATAFGSELYWGNDPQQTCGVREPIIKTIDDIDRLSDPDPLADGDMPDGIHRARRFIEITEGNICVSALDMAGGLNVALDLVGQDLMLMLIDEPDAVHRLLDRVQRFFIRAIEAHIEVVGSEEHFTSLDFPEYWFPEGLKGHASDDVCAMISPETFEQFSLPYLNRVYERFGAGGLHNCGPNPCGHLYNATDPPLRSVNLAYDYSHQDLPALREAFKGRTVLHLDMPGPDPATTYRAVMEIMTPDVVVIPIVAVEQAEASQRWGEMLEVAREYAARMDWQAA